MGERQLARTPGERAAQKLAAVPDPPKRRKSRRRRRFKVGRIFKRKYPDRKELHAYENVVILKALAEIGHDVSAASMRSREPDRWNTSELGKALERMHHAGLVHRTSGWSWGTGNRTYTVKQEEEPDGRST